ncbi:hypothetical protein BBJ28_00006615 [Nothophytophthora sp. Chile5]|nr:hypothetical protein BBJ28_00006615 [Nothophytophthora sp. Chile5]
MKLLLLTARRLARVAAPTAASAWRPAAQPLVNVSAPAGARFLSDKPSQKPPQKPPQKRKTDGAKLFASGSDSDSSDSSDDEEEETKRFTPATATTQPEKPRLSLKEQQAIDMEFWDEERWGALDSEDWQGFEGDLDAVTPEGVPTWLQSVRDLSAIHSENRMRAKLARRAYAESRMNVVRHRTVDEQGRAYGTGRRKTSTARVWIKPAADPFAGRIVVNKMDVVDYFDRDSHREEVLKPFSAVEQIGAFDVYCTVKGGGNTGQAGAVRHGLARALQNWDPELRPALKKAGYLTRDPRMVERKKPGQPKARKKFQWVKR